MFYTHIKKISLLIEIEKDYSSGCEDDGNGEIDNDTTTSTSDASDVQTTSHIDKDDDDGFATITKY